VEWRPAGRNTTAQVRTLMHIRLLPAQ
jgi:hypothetical protein